MPLIATTSQADINEEREAIGIWMSAGEEGLIRVFVSWHALLELDPTGLAGPDAALEIFTTHRLAIEKVASAKFDLEGTSEGDYFEGLPTLILRASDFG
jgi:Protein of unknown function (DUF1488)